MYKKEDLKFMKRAFSLAQRGKGRTGVNPLVGAVIVKGGKILGEGWHIKSGLDHAEIVAMKGIQMRRLKGAIMYVTLEPCCHTGKTTPPCTEKLIEAGFSRIVVAMNDPNVRVDGKGVRILRKAGIIVEVGLMKDKAEAMNESYIKTIGTSLPYVTLKQAVSLDGKIAARDGSSRWISCAESRKEVHRMRNFNDAVMTTGITVKADNPSLGVRMVKGRDPVRIIVDWDMISGTGAKVYRNRDAVVITDTRTDEKKVAPFKKKGIRVLRYGRGKALKPLFKDLYAMGYGNILVEAGGGFAAGLLREKVPDKAVYFVAPVYLGSEGKSAVGELGIDNIRSALHCDIQKIKLSGNDVMIEVSFR